jgi:hypothetical protein
MLFPLSFPPRYSVDVLWHLVLTESARSFFTLHSIYLLGHYLLIFFLVCSRARSALADIPSRGLHWRVRSGCVRGREGE